MKLLSLSYFPALALHWVNFMLHFFHNSMLLDMADPGIMPSLSIVLQRLETSLGLTAFFLTNFALASLIALSQ